MTRPFLRFIEIAAVAGIVLLACEEPVSPARVGGVSVRVLAVTGDNFTLDSGRIIVTGPTTPNPLKVTPGSTTTIGGLSPGSYTVALEGFAGGVVDHFGKSTGVTVVAGQNTAASVSFVPFNTTLTPLPDSVIGKTISVSFTAPSGAASYLVEWTKDQTFASGVSNSSPTVSPAQVPVPDYARYYVRVRAIDPYQGKGPTSSPVSIRTVPVNTAATLVFTVQPTDTTAGQAIKPAVVVAIQDSISRPVGNATNAVTLVIGGPVGATLNGTKTVNAVSGKATFSDLSIDRPGSGFTLTAASVGLTGSVSMSFGIHVRFAELRGGGYHTCGVTSVGSAYCWGSDSTGQVGDGSTANSSTPIPVGGGLTFAVVRAGFEHTCGLTGGGAYCWGFNGQGQVGNGTTTNSLGPVAVAGGLTFVDVRAGGFHTCGLTSGGATYCWGYNLYGELGDSTNTSRLSPVLVVGGLSFVQVRAGFFHTCGLTSGGVAYCWGRNTNGQLGDSTTTDRATPVPVSGGLTFSGLSVGGYHTCGTTTSGASVCWGRNASGQLGDSTTSDRTSPVAVSGGLTFVGLSAGGFHTCGLTSAGVLFCWGNNGDGAVGDSTTTDRASPVAVSGGLNFSQIMVGAYHTCGLTTSNHVAYCWGYNLVGELGNGTTSSAKTPVLVVQ